MSDAASGHELLAPILGAEIARVREAAARLVTSAEPGDEGAVHDLRVALRRLRTALRPAKRVYGKRRLDLVSDALRHHARASGALRDEEVLRETVASIELPPRLRADTTAWLAERRADERAHRSAVAGAVESSAFTAPGGRAAGAPRGGVERVPPILEVLANLGRLLLPRSDAPRAAEIARRSLRHAARAVVDAARVEATDGEALHALRIRFKRLRYTAELFAELHGDLAARVVASATAMQKRLGEVHDLDQAVASVRRAKRLPAAARDALLLALAARRQRAAARAIAELAAALVVVGAAIAATTADASARAAG